MKIENLFFSKKPLPRILCHLLFWLGRLLLYYFLYLSASMAVSENDGSNGFNALISVDSLLTFICLDMIYVYPVVYLFWPAYIPKKKYFTFCLVVIPLTIIVFLAKFFFTLWFKDILTAQITVIKFELWISIISFINSGPPVVCLLFVGIKMLKMWYAREQQKLELVKENSRSELSLLKAQVHPHFLFNTLNNIYSFTLQRSAFATDLLTKLSAILHYISDECNVEFISVERELKILSDYIDLELVRYGNRLKIDNEINGSYRDKVITPLLMIPFIENSFKHGASKILHDPWIKLSVQIDEDVLHFTLTNNRLHNDAKKNHKGIGLNNVKKRLELLHPGDHLLVIESTSNTFTVNMRVPVFPNIQVAKKNILYA